MDETFSTIDIATMCLLDEERTAVFGRAISEVVKPGDIVLDAGTGTGIMSIFAAKAGAKKVRALEYDPYTAKLAYQNAKNNGFGEVISVMLSDARNIHFGKGTYFDVVIMEMLTTGMVDEYQVWAVNNLFEKGYVDERTKFLPLKQDTYVTLVQTDFNNYGLKMRMVKHVWKFLQKQNLKTLSPKKLLSSITFNKINDMNSKTENIFDITEDGVLNSFYLESETWLNSSMKLGDTLALNAPVIYPLDQDIKVKKGDRIRLKIEYMFGNGYRNLQAQASKI